MASVRKRGRPKAADTKRSKARDGTTDIDLVRAITNGVRTKETRDPTDPMADQADLEAQMLGVAAILDSIASVDVQSLTIAMERVGTPEERALRDAMATPKEREAIARANADHILAACGVPIVEIALKKATQVDAARKATKRGRGNKAPVGTKSWQEQERELLRDVGLPSSEKSVERARRK
jgi:hypothetical protein